MSCRPAGQDPWESRAWSLVLKFEAPPAGRIRLFTRLGKILSGLLEPILVTTSMVLIARVVLRRQVLVTNESTKRRAVVHGEVSPRGCRRGGRLDPRARTR